MKSRIKDNWDLIVKARGKWYPRSLVVLTVVFLSNAGFAAHGTDWTEALLWLFVGWSVWVVALSDAEAYRFMRKWVTAVAVNHDEDDRAPRHFSEGQ